MGETEQAIREHFELCETTKSRFLSNKGPWMEEPNRVEFVHAGFRCLLARNPFLLNWCGYVGLEKGHPYYGKSHDKVSVNVHGGLTYAKECQGAVCHISDNDVLYWLGFDCAHSHDLVPGWLLLPGFPGRLLAKAAYRDISYVMAQTKKLAEQLV